MGPPDPLHPPAAVCRSAGLFQMEMRLFGRLELIQLQFGDQVAGNRVPGLMARHVLKLRPAAPIQLSTKRNFPDSRRREREPVALRGRSQVSLGPVCVNAPADVPAPGGFLWNRTEAVRTL